MRLIVAAVLGLWVLGLCSALVGGGTVKDAMVFATLFAIGYSILQAAVVLLFLYVSTWFGQRDGQ